MRELQRLVEGRIISPQLADGVDLGFDIIQGIADCIFDFSYALSSVVSILSYGRILAVRQVATSGRVIILPCIQPQELKSGSFACCTMPACREIKL